MTSAVALIVTFPNFFFPGEHYEKPNLNVDTRMPLSTDHYIVLSFIVAA